MHLLIVDDDANVRDSLAVVLADAGHSIQIAPNGAIALAYLKTATSPHLVLLDCMMPGLDGLAFLRLVFIDQAVPPMHRYVLMTIGDSLIPPTVSAFLTAHAIPLIQKPF
jgi:two-component system nitrogen regulation response regulator NtrX